MKLKRQTGPMLFDIALEIGDESFMNPARIDNKQDCQRQLGS
jgi:hypothetical protein